MKIKGCSKESIAQEKAIKELRTKLKYAKEISQEYLTSNLAVILATWESNSSKWSVMAIYMLIEILKIKISKPKINGRSSE